MCGLDKDDFWAEPLWQGSAIAALTRACSSSGGTGYGRIADNGGKNG